MHGMPLSAHRAHVGICRPHFRFDFAQALQAFDSACVGMVEGQTRVCCGGRKGSVLPAADIDVRAHLSSAQSPCSLVNHPHANPTIERLVRNIKDHYFWRTNIAVKEPLADEINLFWWHKGILIYCTGTVLKGKRYSQLSRYTGEMTEPLEDMLLLAPRLHFV
jgi:hypothetical protein